MKKVEKRIERKFWQDLCKVFQKLLDRVKSGKVPVLTAVRTFTQTPEVNSFINRIVKGMITNQRVASARTWREAASKGSRGKEIYQALMKEMQGPVGQTVQNLVDNNAAYIKTIPQQWTVYVTNYIARETAKGRRPEVIEEELRRILPEHATKNLKCIARTEAAKANAAITEARSYNLGIRAYFWRCVDDERSRMSHKAMDGILVFYDQPPNPEQLFPLHGVKPYGRYHAGNTFNCRCWQEPIVDDHFLPDEMRVYVNGKIQRMTRKQLLTAFGHIAT